MPKWTLLTTLCLTFIFAIAPLRTSAVEVEFMSILPETAEEATEEIIGEDTGAPEYVKLFAFIYDGEPGELYTATFSADESPVMVLVMGGDMTVDENWSYDATTGALVVSLETKSFYVEEGETAPVFTIAVIFPVALGEDGPPEQMTGGWMTTNVAEWELIPPSDENIGFGFKLTGPEGTDGYFHMYIPDTLIDLLGQFKGEEIAIEDLAVFVDDDQASLAIEDVGTGAFININVTFTESNVGVSQQKEEDSVVTKKIVTKEKLAVSLAATKYSVKKGKKIKLYGWVENGKKGQKVTLWSKEKGEKSFTRIATLETKSGGYYSYQVTGTKTTRYKVKWGKKSSEVKKITVK